MPLLCDLIDLPTYPLITIVGAGGKTTTMYTLASELAQRGKRIIITTTTQIFYPEPGETDALIVAADTPILLQNIRAAWQHQQRITVAGTFLRTDKLAGLQLEQPYELLMKSGADAVIVEADGARHRRIKAPAEHEPLIPLQTKIAHRPEHIARVTGISQGDILSPAVIARLITSEQGALKHIPKTASVYLLITHASIFHKETIRELASLVRRSPRVAGVLSSEMPGVWFANV